MTYRSQTSRLIPPRQGRRGLTWLAIAALTGSGAACDTNDDSGVEVSIPVARNGAEQDGQAAGQREPGGGQGVNGDQQTRDGQSMDAQPARQPGEPAGDVSQQAAANVQETVELGAFSPTTPPSEQDAQGRLPAEGDRAIYVASTTLFPGSARIDPGIENPVSGDAEAIAAGERHFNAFNCSGCHAPLAGGGMGPPLTDEAWIYGNGPAQIYLTIMHGRPAGMPAFGSMLPRQTVWELVAYIETLDEIEDYATHAGFAAEHATSVRLPGRFEGIAGTNESRAGQSQAGQSEAGQSEAGQSQAGQE